LDESSELQSKVETALAGMETAIDEVREAITDSGSEGDLVDINVNVEKPGPEADVAAPAEEPLGEVLSASRNHMIKVEALMDMCADELAEASETMANLDRVASDKRGEVVKAVKAALADSMSIMSEASTIVEAKKDKDDEKEDKKDKEDKDEKDDKDDKKDKKDDKECMFCKTNPCKCKGKGKGKKEDKDDKKEAQKILDDALYVRAENRARMLALAECAHAADEQCVECDSDDDLVKAYEDGLGMAAKDKKDEKKDKKKDKKDKKDKEDKDDEEVTEEVEEDDDDAQDIMMMLDDEPMTLEARKAARDEIVSKAGEILNKYELDLGKATNVTEPTYFDAHPGGKGTVTELTHTKTPEAKVETISEIHDIMRDVAESGPRNVREAAERIQSGIVKGAFTEKDVERLVAEGKVDPAAAKYWKQYFGLAPDAGDFGSQMSAEFTSQKKKASNDNWRTKVRRAYDIALEAQDKGLINSARGALESYVDELMSFDDAAFESTKRVVASYKSTKLTSGSVPRVGMDAATEAMEVTASVDAKPVVGMQDTLFSLGWK